MQQIKNLGQIALAKESNQDDKISYLDAKQNRGAKETEGFQLLGAVRWILQMM